MVAYLGLLQHGCATKSLSVLFIITTVSDFFDFNPPETGYVVLFEECSEGSLYFICQGAVLQRRLVRIRRDKILLYSKLDWSRL